MKSSIYKPQPDYIPRLPDDLKRQLVAVAHQNNRTLNDEVIYRLRHSLDQYRRQHSVESEPR